MGFKGTQLTNRHNNGCNVSFADGHCEYRKWKDPRTIRLLQGKPSGAGKNCFFENNPDADWMFEITEPKHKRKD